MSRYRTKRAMEGVVPAPPTVDDRVAGAADPVAHAVGKVPPATRMPGVTS